MTITDEVIKAHLDNGCFAKFSKIDKFNGAILEIPENVILKKPALKCVYEIDDNKINIYINGIKEKSIDCPCYACRPLVSIDMIIRINSGGLSPYLLQILDKDDVIPIGENIQTIPAANLLDSPSLRKDKKLEKELYQLMEKYHITGKKEEVTEGIAEGFSVILKHYNGESNVTKKS